MTLILVSFDLDDTLIFQDSKRKYESLRRVVCQAGCDTSEAALLRAIRKANRFYDAEGYRFANTLSGLWYEYAELVATTLECRSANVIEAIYQFYRTYNRTSENFSVPTNALTLLDNLKKAGLRLTAISSNLEAENRLALCGLGDVFESVFSPAMGIAKTDLFGLLLERQKLASSCCIHVGDDPHLDIAIPRRHKIGTILFDPDGNHTSADAPIVCQTYLEIENVIFKGL